jgi:hypothetical protein
MNTNSELECKELRAGMMTTRAWGGGKGRRIDWHIIHPQNNHRQHHAVDHVNVFLLHFWQAQARFVKVVLVVATTWIDDDS